MWSNTRTPALGFHFKSLNEKDIMMIWIDIWWYMMIYDDILDDILDDMDIYGLFFKSLIFKIGWFLPSNGARKALRTQIAQVRWPQLIIHSKLHGIQNLNRMGKPIGIDGVRWEWGASNPLNNGKNRCFKMFPQRMGLEESHGIMESGRSRRLSHGRSSFTSISLNLMIPQHEIWVFHGNYFKSRETSWNQK